MLTNFGFFQTEGTQRKINFFPSPKLTYFFYRFLVFLRIVKGYDIFVTSSNKVINSINNSISKKTGARTGILTMLGRSNVTDFTSLVI